MYDDIKTFRRDSVQVDIVYALLEVFLRDPRRFGYE